LQQNFCKLSGKQALGSTLGGKRSSFSDAVSVQIFTELSSACQLAARNAFSRQKYSNGIFPPKIFNRRFPAKNIQTAFSRQKNSNGVFPPKISRAVVDVDLEGSRCRLKLPIFFFL
jgi:hypothetical protein